jgi:hypothetical protein
MSSSENQNGCSVKFESGITADDQPEAGVRVCCGARSVVGSFCQGQLTNADTVPSIVPSGTTFPATHIDMTSPTNLNAIVARTGPAQVGTGPPARSFTVIQLPHLAPNNPALDKAQLGETACGIQNIGGDTLVELPVNLDRVSCLEGVQLLRSWSSPHPRCYCDGVQDGLLYCTSGISSFEPLANCTSATIHVRMVPKGGALKPTT